MISFETVLQSRFIDGGVVREILESINQAGKLANE